MIRHQAAGIADAAHNLAGCGPNGIAVAVIPAVLPKASKKHEEDNTLDYSTSLHTWMLNDCASPKQLETCVAAAAAEVTVAIICIDFSRPWTAVQQAEAWLATLKNASLSANAARSATLTDEQMALVWRVSRVLGQSAGPVVPSSTASAEDAPPSRARADSVSSSSTSSSASGSSSAGGAGEGEDAGAESLALPKAFPAARHGKSIATALQQVQQADAPVPAGVLLQSAGMPVLLVPTKMDSTSPGHTAAAPHENLQPLVSSPTVQADVSSRQLDVILADVRRLALVWGAGVVLSAAGQHCGSEALLRNTCRTAAVVQAVQHDRHGAVGSSVPVELPVRVTGFCGMCLPLGCDSASLIADCLALYTGGSGDDADTVDALCIDVVLSEHGEEEQARRAAMLKPAATPGPRFAMFRAEDPSGGGASSGQGGTPSGPHALLMSSWLQELAEAHPSIVQTGSTDSAASAAVRAMAGAAKDSEQALQKLASDERKKQAAEAANSKERPKKNRQEAKDEQTAFDSVAKAKHTAEGTKTERSRRVKSERVPKKAAASGPSLPAAAAAEATSAADFFASMLSSPEPKAKERPRTRATRSSKNTKT